MSLANFPPIPRRYDVCKLVAGKVTEPTKLRILLYYYYNCYLIPFDECVILKPPPTAVATVVGIYISRVGRVAAACPVVTIVVVKYSPTVYLVYCGFHLKFRFGL